MCRCMLVHDACMRSHITTVNCEYFAVKIFLDSLAYVKIKCPKTHVHYYSIAVQGRLSENYLT